MNTVKNKYLHSLSWILAVFLILTSCDNDFDALNTNDAALTQIEPALQLNTAIENSSLNGDHIRCEGSIVKQQMRIFSGLSACGNFNVDQRSTSNSNWVNGYQNVVNNLVDAIENSSDDPSLTNVHNMARIWKAHAFMVLTDSYGEVPYSEAGVGYLEGNAFPSYDSQSSIYLGENGILEELVDATASLDANQPIEGRDILYEGDVTQWKRLGNSLLLRAAMRLSKVNPGEAQDYVGIATSGELMQSNEDNAVIRHNAEYPNDLGGTLNGGNSHYQYLVEDFVDHLQSNDDPRLASIAVRYPGATGSGDQNEDNADRAPENQIGIPMGYDNTNIGEAESETGVSSLFAYSQLDRTRMGGQQAPVFMATYSLQQLLLAEAALRDWTTGDQETLYESGVEANMQQFAEYGEDTAIDQSAIDTYVQANPLPAGGEAALEQINTEYWVASYLIPPETWANFRRSGYPDLEPNPRQGDLDEDENFMRRFGYPDSERSVNSSAVEEGTTPDEIDTRIWWDEEL